jgi:outer membrane autotransporter protein
MTTPQARQAFDLSSGEIHASSQYSIADASDLFTRTVQRRSALISAGDRQFAAWLSVMGASSAHDGDGNAARLSGDSTGLGGGVDFKALPIGAESALSLGFAAGYLRSTANVTQRLSSAKTNSSLIGLYATLNSGPINATAAFSTGWHDLHTQRGISSGQISRTAFANRKAVSTGVSAQIRYDRQFTGFRFSPIVTLDWNHVTMRGAIETGANALNLSLAQKSYTSARIGGGGEIGFGGGKNPLSATLRLTYEDEFGDRLPAQAASFAGSPTAFTVYGPRMRVGGISVGAGLSYKLSPKATLSANYDGNFNADTNQHRGGLALTFGF